MAFHDREHLDVSTADELWDWFLKNHEKSVGVWVVTYKKASGRVAPRYDEMVRVALCFGWVDSVPGKVDEHRTKLYFSPRKKGSGWAATNKARVAELEAAGKLMPAGIASIEAAKNDGSWSKLDSAESAEVPLDLIDAFKRYTNSQENFDRFPLGVRKQILQWIAQAKTAPTREKRIDETARLAADNIRANQWSKKQ